MGYTCLIIDIASCKFDTTEPKLIFQVKLHEVYKHHSHGYLMCINELFQDTPLWRKVDLVLKGRL